MFYALCNSLRLVHAKIMKNIIDMMVYRGEKGKRCVSFQDTWLAERDGHVTWNNKLGLPRGSLFATLTDFHRLMFPGISHERFVVAARYVCDIAHTIHFLLHVSFLLTWEACQGIYWLHNLRRIFPTTLTLRYVVPANMFVAFFCVMKNLLERALCVCVLGTGPLVILKNRQKWLKHFFPLTTIYLNIGRLSPHLVMHWLTAEKLTRESGALFRYAKTSLVFEWCTSDMYI